MRVKWLGDQAVDVPELGQTVEPGEIVDAPDELAKRMAESALWRITSRGARSDAGDEPEADDTPDTEEEEE